MRNISIPRALAAGLLVASTATAALAQSPPPGRPPRSEECGSPWAGPTASCG